MLATFFAWMSGMFGDPAEACLKCFVALKSIGVVLVFVFMAGLIEFVSPSSMARNLWSRPR
jgi:hypothetical protein